MRRPTRQRFRAPSLEGLEAREVLTFTPLSPVGVGDTPYALAVGDVNRDGSPDVVSANSNAGTVSVRLGDGLGGFTSIAEIAVGGNPLAVALGDVNRDGRLDLVAADYADGTVSVRLGDGLGGFSGSTTVGVGDAPYAVVLADFDRDGRLDLATANQAGNSVSVRLGVGDGTFIGNTEVGVGVGPVALAVGDFDRNGTLDLATANNDAGTVSVRLGDGAGGFAGSTEVAVGPLPTSLVIADFDRDGTLDLAATNYNDDRLAVQLGVGDGTFAAAADVPVGDTPWAVAAVDVDGDGTLDLVATTYADNGVSVRLGLGDGTFVADDAVAVGGGPLGVAVADVNRDGKPDLLVADSVASTISVLRNDYAWLVPTTFAAADDVPPTPGRAPVFVATADVNGDGRLDVVTANGVDAPLNVRLGLGDGTFTPTPDVAVGSGPVAVAIGDFNGDGAADLVAVNQFDNTVSVRLGQGDGTFAAAGELAVGSAPGSLAVGDFNGDGQLDVVVGSRFGPTTVWLGGDGGFVQGPDVRDGAGLGGVTAGDFNGDGTLDLAGVLSDLVLIRLGNGDGTFSLAPNVPVGASPAALAVGDFDRDGDLDFAAANGNAGTVSVRLGRGDGTFVAAPDVPVDPGPAAIAAADVDRDGRLDFVTGNSAVDAPLSVRLGRGDGTFLTAPSVPAGRGSYSVAVGDFNGDAQPDVASADVFGGTLAIRLASPDLAVAVDLRAAYYSAPAQRVTLSARAFLRASGTITFTLKQGDTVVGSPVTGSVDDTGLSTVEYPLPAGQDPGRYTVEATYTGDGDATGTGSLVLSKVVTETTLATPGPTAYGDDVVLTATVRVVRGAADLTGLTVSFFNRAANPALLGSGTLARVADGYQASYTIVGGLNAGTNPRLSGVLLATSAVELSADEDVSHTVSPRPLTITALDATRYFSEANPAFTATIVGLVNGDKPGVVSGLTITTAATPANLPGDYAIVAAGGTAANYVITHVNGTLRVLTLPVLAVGADAGGASLVRYYTVAGQAFTLQPYGAASRVGLRVATGDVNGDGYEDVVVAPGVGGKPVVKAYSGRDGQLLASFPAYALTFTRGLYVAAGDVLGLGRAQILVGPGAGGAPVVKVYDLLNPTPLRQTLTAFAGAFRGGVSVAASAGAVVVGTASRSGYARRYSGANLRTTRLYTPFGAWYAGGVTVAAADGWLAVGRAAGAAEVKVIEAATGTVLASLTAHAGGPRRGYAGGARVAFERDAAYQWEVVVGSGPGWAARAAFYPTSSWLRRTSRAEFGGWLNGVRVG